MVVRGHLGQNAPIAQARTPVAKTGKVTALQQFGKYDRAGTNNFSAARLREIPRISLARSWFPLA